MRQRVRFRGRLVGPLHRLLEQDRWLSDIGTVERRAKVRSAKRQGTVQRNA
jgi:hypothetical protein